MQQSSFASRSADWAQRLIPSWGNTSAPEMLLAVSLVLTPLAIGGVHLPTRIAAAVLTTLAFLWTAHRLRAQRRKVRIGWAGLGLIIVAGWAFFQWVPLPAGLVETLAPGSAEARSLAATALGVELPSWFPISLDGGQTAAAWVALVAALSTYLLAANLRIESGVRDRIVVYIEVAGLMVLVVSLLHKALGLDQIYGVYESTVDLSGRLLITPFVNPNHAAALFLLGAVTAYGCWMRELKESRWHLACSVILSMAVVGTLSRANTLLLFGAIVLMGIIIIPQHRHKDLRPRVWRLAIGVASCIFVAVVLIGPQVFIDEFSTLGDLDNEEVGLVKGCWGVGLDVAKSHLFSGTGYGAFSVAATGTMDSWGLGLVAYSHNGILQLVAELGLPVAIAVLCLLGFGLIRAAIPGRKDLAQVGVVVALFVLFIQNQVDFSLYLLGVGLPAAAAFGWVVGETWREEERRRPQLRWHSVYSVAVIGALVVVSLHAWAERPEAWRGQVVMELDNDKPGRVPVDELLLAHPSDFYAFRLGSVLATNLDDAPLAQRLMQRAHELAPFEPETSAIQAETLLGAGDLDGGLEVLNVLVTQDLLAERRALDVVLAKRDDRALVERFFGSSPERIKSGADRLLTLNQPRAAMDLLNWGVSRYPKSLLLFEALGSRWAASKDHAEQLDALSFRLLGTAGHFRDKGDTKQHDVWARAGYLMHGHVVQRQGKALEAWHLFLESADLTPAEQPDLAVDPLLAASNAALSMSRWDLLDEGLARLKQLKVKRGWPKGKLHFLRSQQAEAKGELRLAIREMHAAARYIPHNPAFHDRLALLFDSTDDPISAERIRARAAQLRSKARVKPRDKLLNLQKPKSDVMVPPGQDGPQAPVKPGSDGKLPESTRTDEGAVPAGASAPGKAEPILLTK